MKKSDLKNRMVVEYRNGERRMVVDDLLIGRDYYTELGYYNDNLEFINTANYDIVRVYPEETIFSRLSDIDFIATPIWERSEVKEVTMVEVEEKFGCKVKIVKEKSE